MSLHRLCHGDPVALIQHVIGNQIRPHTVLANPHAQTPERLGRVLHGSTDATAWHTRQGDNLAVDEERLTLVLLTRPLRGQLVRFQYQPATKVDFFSPLEFEPLFNFFKAIPDSTYAPKVTGNR